MAARLRLGVAAEVDDVALGLLDPSVGAAHVVGWEAMLEQRVGFDEHVRKDHLPVPVYTTSFLILIDRPSGVRGQWLSLSTHCSVN